MRRAGLLAALAAGEMGCALVLRGGKTTQRIAIETDPPGAIAATPRGRCETPCTLELPRKGDAAVEISKDGYEPTTAVLRSRLGAAMLANVLLSVPGVVIGIPVDVLSGAAYQLVPEEARVALRPVAQGPPPGAEGGGAVVPSAMTTGPPPAPAPRAILLEPRPPGRLAVSAYFGEGVTHANGEMVTMHFGVLATGRVWDRVLVGAALDRNAEANLFGGATAIGTFVSAVAGVEALPSPSSRLVALLQVGGHEMTDFWGTVTLPAAGVRIEWTAVMRDRITLGGWAAYWHDLGTEAIAVPSNPAARAGGSTGAIGFSLGVLAL